MIPDHLIDKAAAAIYAVSVFGDKFAIDAWHDMSDDNPVKTTTRMYARAALEATAAHIWDQGYRAGFSDGPFICACNAWNEGECACGNYGNGETPYPNPYRASETA